MSPLRASACLALLSSAALALRVTQPPAAAPLQAAAAGSEGTEQPYPGVENATLSQPEAKEPQPVADVVPAVAQAEVTAAPVAAQPQVVAAPAEVQPEVPAAPPAVQPETSTAPSAVQPQASAAPVAAQPETNATQSETNAVPSAGQPEAPSAAQPEAAAVPAAVPPESTAAPAPTQPKVAPKASSRDNGDFCIPPQAFRQEMDNFFDLQYHTRMNLGGQPIQGIVDTGSFELVVFSKTCPTCGIAAAYSEKQSTTFHGGNHSKVMSYGSGSCRVVEGNDDIGLGCYKASNQSMWLAVDCQMPLLAEATFNAIVGVGPPGQPEFMARTQIEQLKVIKSQLNATGQPLPPDLEVAEKQLNEELENALTQTAMLDSFGIKTFSTCLGREPKSPGWMIWNDITRADVPGVKKIPVVGNITWGVRIESLAFRMPGSPDMIVACKDGCGAVVDTGTSLFGLPSSGFQSMATAIQSSGWATDCSDLRKFPELIVNTGGHALRFPPSTYLGAVQGNPSVDMARYMNASSSLTAAAGGATPCQLLLMDIGEQQTQFGPMFILGMPFFREYYTTFDLGSGRGDRSLFVSPASESCEPDLQGNVQAARSHSAIAPRLLDASKMQGPRWLKSFKGNTI